MDKSDEFFGALAPGTPQYCHHCERVTKWLRLTATERYNYGSSYTAWSKLICSEHETSYGHHVYGLPDVIYEVDMSYGN
jgi:hypothetical protein